MSDEQPKPQDERRSKYPKTFLTTERLHGLSRRENDESVFTLAIEKSRSLEDFGRWHFLGDSPAYLISGLDSKTQIDVVNQLREQKILAIPLGCDAISGYVSTAEEFTAVNSLPHTKKYGLPSPRIESQVYVNVKTGEIKLTSPGIIATARADGIESESQAFELALKPTEDTVEGKKGQPLIPRTLDENYFKEHNLKKKIDYTSAIHLFDSIDSEKVQVIEKAQIVSIDISQFSTRIKEYMAKAQALKPSAPPDEVMLEMNEYLASISLFFTTFETILEELVHQYNAKVSSEQALEYKLGQTEGDAVMVYFSDKNMRPLVGVALATATTIAPTLPVKNVTFDHTDLEYIKSNNRILPRNFPTTEIMERIRSLESLHKKLGTVMDFRTTPLTFDSEGNISVMDDLEGTAIIQAALSHPDWDQE